MNPVDALVHSTVKIIVKRNDNKVSSGTGFHTGFNQPGNCHVPAIITNKHVIENAKTITFIITLADEKGQPIVGNQVHLELDNFRENLYEHPTVDLAMFLVGPLIAQAKEKGLSLFYNPIALELIPSDERRKSFAYMEDIMMIGYPNGISDIKHNLPVIRRGVTATNCNIDFNGKPEFLTDIASFPGSSGSPVFLVSLGGFLDQGGKYQLGKNRLHFIGVHYAGATHTAEGEIKIKTAPTSNMAFPLTEIPMNIGVVINSKEILYFERLVSERLKEIKAKV